MKYLIMTTLGFFFGLLLFSGSAPAHNDPAAMVCGDVNGDAVVTASDALRTLAKAVGLNPEMRCNNRRNY